MEWAEIARLSIPIAFVAFFIVYWDEDNGDGAHAQVVVPAGHDAGPDGDKTQ